MTLIAAIATAFNFLIIIWKFINDRVLEGTIDATIFIAICILFAGTITGLQIGMIASFIVSICLLFMPITNKKA